MVSKISGDELCRMSPSLIGNSLILLSLSSSRRLLCVFLMIQRFIRLETVTHTYI